MGLKNKIRRIKSETTEEHEHGKWALQPYLTVKRRVHFDGQDFAQVSIDFGNQVIPPSK
jgi:hypothetical protein